LRCECEEYEKFESGKIDMIGCDKHILTSVSSSAI
jgi:hypothetical protein